MSHRVYCFGNWMYKVPRRGWVERWDPYAKTWRPVAVCASRKDGRRLAALDAYRRGVNP